MLRSRLANQATARQPSTGAAAVATQQTRQYGGALSTSKPRRHGHPRQLPMYNPYPHWRTVPDSHKPTFKNEFKLQHYSEHVKDMAVAPKWPPAKSPHQCWDSTIGDPHQWKGWFSYEFAYQPYSCTWEPSFPPMPNVKKGQMLAGAQFYRTQAWKEAMSSPTEPAISTIGRLDPDNQRAVDAAMHLPNPDSTVPDGEYDYRHARLNPNHADRRAAIYLMSAGMTACSLAFVRGILHKVVYQMWPCKGVFAAAVTEVDIRGVEVGTNYVTKWRGKPVFIKRRTPEQIQRAQADDAIVGSLRDPQTDAQRVTRPEWLIVLGVCTHLGCTPYADQGNWGGFFCPCHGSHYDLSGRVRLGPAPLNLEIPPHEFLDDFTLKIG